MLRCARFERHADGLLLGWFAFTECQLSRDPETMSHCRGVRPRHKLARQNPTIAAIIQLPT